MNDYKLRMARHRRGEIAVSIGERILPYTELTLVFSGCLEYYTENRWIRVEAGDGILIRKGQVRARKASEAPAEYISFNYDTDAPVNLPTFIRGGIGSEVRHLLAAFDRWQERRLDAHRVEKTERLIPLLLLALEDTLRRRNTHPLVEKITEYLYDNMEKPITLQDVADHLFFSPVYCDSLFRKETGTSIIRYLLDLRIEKAKLLLADSTDSVAHVGETVGFSDANYFSRQFKKRTGVTPGSWRRQSIGEE